MRFVLRFLAAFVAVLAVGVALAMCAPRPSTGRAVVFASAHGSAPLRQ